MEPYVEILYCRNDWNAVLNACRTTIHKDAISKEPKPEWRKKLLLAEHSPIRLLHITIKVHNVKSWIATHFARHHIGVEKFISTQRDDRTGTDRDSARQDALVDMELDMNAQAIINISKKRLCTQAHAETRAVWIAILEVIKQEMPELYEVCVPECVYRGFCPELYPCGYANSKAYEIKTKEYRRKD